MSRRYPRYPCPVTHSQRRPAALPTLPPPYRGVTEVTRARVTGGMQPIARLVADLAERVARLSPSHRDPEAFHIAKHTLASELRALARAMELA